MKYIDAEKMIAVVEQYLSYYRQLNRTRKVFDSVILPLEELLEDITYLQQEQPPLPSNLDEVAEEYANKEYPNEPAVGQWGTGDYEPPIDMEYPREVAKDAFKAGAKWQKAKMMEEAVECMVMDFSSNLPRPQVDIRLDPGKYYSGDKVKVIVIKED